MKFEMIPTSMMKICSLCAPKFIFALILVVLAPCTLAASFDCTKAVSVTEKLICSDTQTSTLDDKLQQAYKTALALTDAYGKKRLAKEQRNWIEYTRGICQNAACLQQAYATRIAVLARNERNIENDEPYCTKPTGYQGGAQGCGISAQAYRDPNEHIDLFNQSLALHRQSGQIIGCSRLIDLWDGTHIGLGRGEQTLGGYCVLQNGTQRQNVMICNDDMVGDFQMQQVAPRDISDKNLIDFTYNCSGN